MTGPLLRVEDLRKAYPVAQGLWSRRHAQVRAVDGISFSVDEGEMLALVGESGCGKSTVARCILRLAEPTSGRILFRGENVTNFSSEELRRYRRQVQIVFQDPFGTLNPRMTVGQLVSEPLYVHGLVHGRREARAEVARVLGLVGLSPVQSGRYPHELSGGQRQRVVIARALALRPRMIILDEPIAALDVSIGAQILNLLTELQEELGVAYLLISHDLSLVRHVADRVAVMYLGVLAETAHVGDLFEAAHHPYTQALLSAVPVPDPIRERERETIPLPGEVPEGLEVPCGCRFHPRCYKAEPVCAEEEPPLAPIGGRCHRAACWFAEARRVI